MAQHGVMEKYKDATGGSTIAAYEIGRDYIKVQFKDESVYLYNYVSPGRDALERMKELARRGEGLSTFINARVRRNYAGRLK